MPDSRDRLTGREVLGLYNAHAGPWAVRDARINRCRDLVDGKLPFELPADFDVPAGEHLVFSLPEKALMPLRLKNVLGRRRPRLKRHPRNESTRAKTVASSIETGINAAMEQRADWSAIAGRLLLDGECAVISQPSDAWALAPLFKDDDGKVNKAYVRDKEGRAPGEDGFARYSATESKKAWESDDKDYRARRLPLNVRAIQATDCIPILSGATDARGPVTDGLLVRTTYTREQLLRMRYGWGSPADGQVIRSAAVAGAEMELYEYWGLDSHGDPYVSYCVVGGGVGYETTMRDRDDEVGPALIDLKSEHGLCKNPARYGWGWHWDTEDYPRRGVPLMYPLVQSILNAEALGTSMEAHTYQFAFGGFGYEIDPNLPPEVYMQAGRPRSFDYAPMKVIPLPGRVQPLVHPGAGGDARDLLGMILESIGKESPAASAFGGGGAASGIDRTLGREFLEAALAEVRAGALWQYEHAAETGLEILCREAEQAEKPVVIYATVPNPQVEAGEAAVSTRALVEIRPDWTAGLYDLEAQIPADAGDNLALMQLLGEHYLRGLITWEEYRERAHGDEAPELSFARIRAQKMLESEAGEAQVQAIVAQLQGDEEALDRIRLQGRMNAQGTPAAVTDGLGIAPELMAAQGGPNGQAAMSGMGMGSPAASQLGGIVAGAMGNARAAQQAVAEPGIVP